VDAYVNAVVAEGRAADFTPVEDALAAYAEKLTRTPQAMTRGDVESLRAVGLEDVQIHEAVQVIGYFNYINRVADGLDVDLEPEMPPHPREAGDERPGGR
jgi:uncharacterized peroxidase-related enzyme